MSSIDLRSKSYLLRLWSEWRDGRWVQRASLEDAHTGERMGFADLESLFDHLREEAGCAAEGRAPPRNAEREGRW